MIFCLVMSSTFIVLLTAAPPGSCVGRSSEFAPLNLSSAVITDVIQLAGDVKKLATDTKALTAAQRKTLATDEKAIAAAVKAIKATLAPLVTILKHDASTWAATLKADNAAIRKDRKNATALAAAEAKLSSDKISAFKAIVTDVTAITSAIETNTGVSTAQAKLATDLPTIGTDVSNIEADQSKLVSDL